MVAANNPLSGRFILQTTFPVNSTSSTVGATRETSEPNASSFGTVWWEYRRPTVAPATLRFSTSNSGISNNFWVYSGPTAPTFATLVLVGTGNKTTDVVISSPPSTRYYIQAEGASGVGGSVSLTVAHGALPSMPTNDNFANRQAISGTSGTPGYSNFLSTVEINGTEVGPFKFHTVWFEWTCTTAGFTTFEPSVSSQFLQVYKYTGGGTPDETNLTSVYQFGQFTSPAFFDAVPGTYYIQIDDIAGVGRTGCTLTYSTYTGPSAPNDDWADAITITGASGSQAWNGYGATVDPDDAVNFTTEPSIWFKWTAPFSGTVVITDIPVNGVSPRWRKHPTNEVIVGDQERFHAKAGVTYYLAFYFSGGTRSGTFSWDLSALNPNAPSNDFFDDRMVLSGPSHQVAYDLTNATREFDDWWWDGKNVWYEWVAPADGWCYYTSTNEDTYIIVLREGGWNDNIDPANPALGDLDSYHEAYGRREIFNNNNWEELGDGPPFRVFECKAGVPYYFGVDTLGETADLTGEFIVQLMKEVEGEWQGPTLFNNDPMTFRYHSTMYEVLDDAQLNASHPNPNTRFWYIFPPNIVPAVGWPETSGFVTNVATDNWLAGGVDYTNRFGTPEEATGNLFFHDNATYPWWNHDAAPFTINNYLIPYEDGGADGNGGSIGGFWLYGRSGGFLIALAPPENWFDFTDENDLNDPFFVRYEYQGEHELVQARWTQGIVNNPRGVRFIDPPGIDMYRNAVVDAENTGIKIFRMPEDEVRWGGNYEPENVNAPERLSLYPANDYSVYDPDVVSTWELLEDFPPVTSADLTQPPSTAFPDWGDNEAPHYRLETISLTMGPGDMDSTGRMAMFLCETKFADEIVWALDFYDELVHYIFFVSNTSEQDWIQRPYRKITLEPVGGLTLYPMRQRQRRF